ncbi:FtsZ-binding cell division protein ZapB [Pseudomonas frederiksbergensis]|uniref:hypothetical protein n=1 Tax=Pseudomonas frederiksbergensis TaxID=104087 RepID=UPI003D211430
MNRGEINKQAALQNIILKKEILQTWTQSIPLDSEGRAEYYPNTIRQFNGWDLSQNSPVVRSFLPPIFRNANDTINNYPALRAEVQVTIALLAKTVHKTRDKGERLKGLKREISELNNYIRALEEELISLRMEHSDWTQRTIASQEKYQALVDDFRSFRDSSGKEYEAIKNENCELKKKLTKVTGLRVVHNAPNKN